MSQIRCALKEGLISTLLKAPTSETTILRNKCKMLKSIVWINQEGNFKVRDENYCWDLRITNPGYKKRQNFTFPMEEIYLPKQRNLSKTKKKESWNHTIILRNICYRGSNSVIETLFAEAWTELLLDCVNPVTLELCSSWRMYDLVSLSIIKAGRKGIDRVIESLQSMRTTEAMRTNESNMDAFQNFNCWVTM